VAPPVSWETSLFQWGLTRWTLTSTVWSAMTDPQARAVAAFARKVTKKKAHWMTAFAPGGVTTAKPVGTRMGKGKGKAAGHRRWLARGSHLGVLTGRLPLRLSVLGGRTSSRVTVVPHRY